MVAVHLVRRRERRPNTPVVTLYMSQKTSTAAKLWHEPMRDHCDAGITRSIPHMLTSAGTRIYDPATPTFALPYMDS